MTGDGGAEVGPSPAAGGGEHLRLRVELMEAVRGVIRRRGLRQRDAAELFDVAQPRVSDLVRGKVALFSIDTLVDMLAAVGVRVELKLRSVRQDQQRLLRDSSRRAATSSESARGEASRPGEGPVETPGVGRRRRRGGGESTSS